jgi:hypothetical protein
MSLDEQTIKENQIIDPEEQAYFNAKKNVKSIHKARKLEKSKK